MIARDQHSWSLYERARQVLLATWYEAEAARWASRASEALADGQSARWRLYHEIAETATTVARRIRARLAVHAASQEAAACPIAGCRSCDAADHLPAYPSRPRTVDAVIDWLRSTLPEWWNDTPGQELKCLAYSLIRLLHGVEKGRWQP